MACRRSPRQSSTASLGLVFWEWCLVPPGARDRFLGDLCEWCSHPVVPQQVNIYCFRVSFCSVWGLITYRNVFTAHSSKTEKDIHKSPTHIRLNVECPFSISYSCLLSTKKSCAYDLVQQWYSIEYTPPTLLKRKRQAAGCPPGVPWSSRLEARPDPMDMVMWGMRPFPPLQENKRSCWSA